MKRPAGAIKPRIAPFGVEVDQCPGCSKPVFWAQTTDGVRFMLDVTTKVVLVTVNADGSIGDTNPVSGEPIAHPSVACFALHAMVCQKAKP